MKLTFINKNIIGYSLVFLMGISILSLSGFAVNYVYRVNYAINEEYNSYIDIFMRKKDLVELKRSQKIVESDLNAREDLFLSRAIIDGYTFFEKNLTSLATKYQGSIISSNRLAYKDISGLTPIGYTITIRLKDGDLASFFKELDNSILRRAMLDKASIKLAYPGRVSHEPPVDVSLDFVLFCKKAEIL